MSDLLESESFPLTTPVGSKVTVAEAIAGQLIRLIMDGRFKAGDRLPTESDLARQFQVGRGSVREALKSLCVVGLIRVERGKGTFVNEPSSFLMGPISLGFDPRTEVDSLIDARTFVEVKLAALAARKAKPEDLRTIESYLEKMCLAMAPEQAETFLNADMGFHFAIATAAQNRILSQFLTLIRNLMRHWIIRGLQVRGLSEKAVQDHVQIFGAIKTHRPMSAAKAMRRHLLNMGNLLFSSEKTPAE